MADNSTLPVSVGTEVFANKDVSGVKFPKVILHDVTGTPVTITGGALSVIVPAALPPAPQAIGSSSSVALSIGSAPTTISVNPPISTSAYTTLNVVGGVMTFTGIGRDPNNSGVLDSFTIDCKSVQTCTFNVYVFNSNPAVGTYTDHGAPAISGADKFALFTKIPMTQVDSGLGTHTIWKPDYNKWNPEVFSGTTLYAVAVVVGTPTFAALDLQFTMGAI